MQSIVLKHVSIGVISSKFWKGFASGIFYLHLSNAILLKTVQLKEENFELYMLFDLWRHFLIS